MRWRVHNISQGRGRRRVRAAQTSKPPLITCHQCRYKRARPLAPRRTSRPRIDHAVNGYHACAPAAPVPPSVQTKRSSNRGEARTTHAMDSTPGGRPEATGRDTTDATMRNVESTIILSHARRTRHTHSTRVTGRFMPKRDPILHPVTVGTRILSVTLAQRGNDATLRRPRPGLEPSSSSQMTDYYRKCSNHTVL